MFEGKHPLHVQVQAGKLRLINVKNEKKKETYTKFFCFFKE